MKDKQEPRKSPLNAYARYSGLGIQMILIFCLAAWAGIRLDNRFELKYPLFTIFFLLFSVIANIYFVIKMVAGK